MGRSGRKSSVDSRFAEYRTASRMCQRHQLRMQMLVTSQIRDLNEVRRGIVGHSETIAGRYLAE
jgi:hypothetical protein